MSQHDMNIANASGATVRADINNALAALVSNSSGASAPTTTFAYQLWVDTTTGKLKMRDAANADWVTIGISLAESGVLLMDERAAPTVAASQGGVYTKDTGGQPELFFREESDGDEVQITTGGVLKIAGAGSQIKLDDLGTPDDNTDLNASTLVHGLLPKLSGSTATYLRADGSWAMPAGSAKAWVNFNGTGAVAARGSYNVSSVADDGTGLYTINFTTAFSDTNYCAVCCAALDATTGRTPRALHTISYAVGALQVNSVGAAGSEDALFCNVAVYA